MFRRSYSGCHVEYGQDRIVLQGDTSLILAEADKLLQLFRCSSRPLCVLSSRRHRIVLGCDD